MLCNSNVTQRVRTWFSPPETLPHHHKSVRNLLVRLLQNLHQIIYIPRVVGCDEGVRCSLAGGSCCTTDTVDVVLGRVGVVEVYHVRDVGYV